MFGYVKKKIILEEIKKEMKIYDDLKTRFAVEVQKDLKDILSEDEFQILVVEPIKFGIKIFISRYNISQHGVDGKIASDISLYNSYLDSWYTICVLLNRLEHYPVNLKEVES